MMKLFLCDARRQKRSIVDLCEHFGVRRIRAKRVHQNHSYLKIVDDETIFVTSKVAKAQFTQM